LWVDIVIGFPRPPAAWAESRQALLSRGNRRDPG